MDAMGDENNPPPPERPEPLPNPVVPDVRESPKPERRANVTGE